MNTAAQDGCTPTDPPTESPAIRYGKLARPDIARLADLARNLKECPLRVLIALRALTLEADSDTITVSTTQLATATNQAQSAVRRALTSLAAANYITVRAATATRPTIVKVNAFATAEIGPAEGVPLRGTPPGASKGHTLCLFEAPPAPLRGTPPTENTELAATAAAVEISSASLQMINRVFSATPEEFDPDTLAHFRRWLHGYMTKLGRDDRNEPTPNAHPPGDDLVAHFLAIAEPRRLATMLDSLLLDRQTCHSYGWFLIVGLQRIHGINVDDQRKARAALAVVRKKGRAVEPTWTQQTLTDIAAIAARKKLR